MCRMTLYEIECPVCDIKTTVAVHYEEDRPACCPMCGQDNIDADSSDADIIYNA